MNRVFVMRRLRAGRYRDGGVRVIDTGGEIEPSKRTIGLALQAEKQVGWSGGIHGDDGKIAEERSSFLRDGIVDRAERMAGCRSVMQRLEAQSRARRNGDVEKLEDELERGF